MKEDIVIELVNAGQWEKAKQELIKLKKENVVNDTMAILEAAINHNEMNYDAEYRCIAEGLKCNYKNYELYVMLGDYYYNYVKNVNQAYLCYENAEFFCEDEQDKQYIIDNKERLKKETGFMVKPVSIVIVSYNNKQMMIDCVKSIRETNLESSYELVIVDNASTDGVAEWLNEQQDITLVRNSENKGFGGGSNQGVKAAQPENDIFFLNNDTLVPANAIFWLRMGLYENVKIGATGAVSNYVGNCQQIEDKFETVEEYIDFAKVNNIPIQNPYEEKVWLSGFAVLIKRRALDEVGLFDMRFGKGYYEDDDIGVRLQYAGYRLLLCRNSFILHFGSKSFQKDWNNYIQLLSGNRWVFRDKWGFDIEKYTYPKNDIIKLINANKDEKIRILHVGCGAGATLARIKYLWPNAILKGIEPDKNVAKLGENSWDIIQCDYEQLILPYEKEYFDYIILDEVLEQVYSPEKILECFLQYLKPEGDILASIYNVMHMSVVIPLLKGIFEYKDDGILAQNHIRFFSIFNIGQLFQKCNLNIEELTGISGCEDVIQKEKKTYTALCEIISDEEKELFQVYQYIVKAKKCLK